MDESQQTQNLFHPGDPGDDQTRLIGPPPQWPALPPVRRRRGPLIIAGVVVLAAAGLVVGIVLAVPSSPPTPSNAAVAAPASTAPSLGRRVAGHPKLGPGESMVVGTISSVTGGQLVIAPTKGGNPVTVTTNDTTKVAGGATSLTDLRPGEHVQVIVRAGTAVTIRARQAAASATPTG
jgi:hypothetical protein